MSEKRFTVSLKGARASEPWVVINAQDVMELNMALDELTEGFALQRIAEVNSLLAGTLNVVNGTTPVPARQVAAGSDEPAQAATTETAPPARQRGGAAPQQSSYGRKKATAGTGGRGGKKPKLTYAEASADCPHGERRRYAKDDWVAYFCPLDKNDPNVCAANFIDASEDEEQ